MPNLSSPGADLPASSGLPVPGGGTARLRLYVPSGAYITIDGRPTRNRVWNKHRHFLISDIGPRGRKVTIRVGLRDENCDCDTQDCRCEMGLVGDMGDLDCCGHRLKVCCKTAYLLPDDDEYLSFDSLSLDTSSSTSILPTLGFTVLSEQEFGPELIQSACQAIANDHAPQQLTRTEDAAQLAPQREPDVSISVEIESPVDSSNTQEPVDVNEEASGPPVTIRTSRTLETWNTYNATSKSLHTIDTMETKLMIMGQPEVLKSYHQTDHAIDRPHAPNPDQPAGMREHRREVWIEHTPSVQ
ncbi:hypothetical protein [Stieleria neptunia]|nr:hypothetical protein [Stieleria neptunia]